MVRKKISFLGTHRRLLFMRGIAGFFSLVLGFYAISHINLSDVTILWKTSAIFTVLLSVVILKERISTSIAIYIVIAFIGAALVVKPQMDVINVPGLAALAAGFAVSIVALSIRKLHNSEDSLTIVFNFCLWGTILGLLLSIGSFVVPNSSEAMVLLGIGIAGTIGQLCFTHAFRFSTAAQIQPYQYFEVIVAMMLGATLWGEFPDLLALIGTVLIVICGVRIYRAFGPMRRIS